MRVPGLIVLCLGCSVPDVAAPSDVANTDGCVAPPAAATRGSRPRTPIDFNRDGLADFAVGHEDVHASEDPDAGTAESVRVYFGTRGGIGPQANLTIPNPRPGRAGSLTDGIHLGAGLFPMRDLDRDGAADLLVTASWAGQPDGIIALSARTGRELERGRSFGWPAPYLTTTIEDGAMRVLAADDVDGDGATDVLAVGTTTGELAVFLERGGRLARSSAVLYPRACVVSSPVTEPRHPFDEQPLFEPLPWQATLADVTGDRRADLIVPIATRGRLEVGGDPRPSVRPIGLELWLYRGTDDGLDPIPLSRVPVDVARAHEVLVSSPGDVDGDGSDEVFVRTWGFTEPVRVYRGGARGLARDRTWSLDLPPGFDPAEDRFAEGMLVRWTESISP